jgi:phenylpropionate dioxygenase-like ring-hydroxylating dioxygenase large terminal subunit
MAETSTLPHWQPVALACDVPAHSPVGVRLRGQELVLWRDPAGQVRAWRDRCPHRGMRLSLGFLREGKLACPYHGWRFDSSGHCAHIPAHPDVSPPPAIAVESFPAGESHAMVWVRTGSGPELPAAAEHSRPVRSVTVRRSPAVVLDGLAAHFGGFHDEVAGVEQRLYRLPTECGLLAIGLHEVDEATTALHVTHAGPAGDQFLAVWAQTLGSFRTSLERA